MCVCVCVCVLRLIHISKFRQIRNHWEEVPLLGSRGAAIVQIEACRIPGYQRDEDGIEVEMGEDVWALDAEGMVYVWVPEIEAFESLNNAAEIRIDRIALNGASICWGYSSSGLYCLSKHRLQLTYARHFIQVICRSIDLLRSLLKSVL